MLASASGPLGALLVIAPLAAIPVFAIVGIPQFAPVVASSADEEELIEPGTETVAETQPPLRKRPSRSASDLFAPLGQLTSAADGSSGESSLLEGTRSSSEPGSTPRAAPRSQLSDPLGSQWEFDEGDRRVPRRPDETGSGRGKSDNNRRPSSSRQLEDEFPDMRDGLEAETPPRAAPDSLIDRVPAEKFRQGLIHPPQRKPDTAEPGDHPSPALADEAPDYQALLALEQSGWRDAARCLKEFGIRKYRLEWEVERQLFLFRCDVASQENSQTIQRFEADADSPLGAVQEVLRQVEAWYAQHESVAAADRE